MRYNPYPATPWHDPVKLEHRITSAQAAIDRLEERDEDHREETDSTLEEHEKRITFLERMLQVILYAIGALIAGKSGDLAEFVLSILRAKS